MEKSRTKLLLAGSVFAVAIAVLCFRVTGVLREHGYVADDDEGVGCAERIVREMESEPPRGLVLGRVVWQRQPPVTPHLRIGRIKLRGSIGSHRKTLGRPMRAHPCLYQEVLAMGGNGYLVEGMDEEAPGLESGEAILEETVYLLHAGPLPAAWRARLGAQACQVAEVVPGGEAERAGLRPADLLLEVAGSTGAGGPCAAVRALEDAVPGSSLRLTVLRDGAPVELKLTKQAGRYGYGYGEVPVLPVSAAP